MSYSLKRFILSTVVFLSASSAHAKADFKANLLLFASANSFNSPELNSTLDSEGLKKMDGLLGVGAEFSVPMWNLFSLGLRVGHHTNRVSEKTATNTSLYYGDLRQNYFAAMARFYLINTSFLHLSAFAGAGLTNTKLEVSTSAGEGSYGGLEQGGNDTMAITGASVGVGLFNVLLYLEAGHEHNNVNGFTRDGRTSTSLKEIDLSGPYVLIGLLINGVPGAKQK